MDCSATPNNLLDVDQLAQGCSEFRRDGSFNYDARPRPAYDGGRKLDTPRRGRPVLREGLG